MKQVKITVIRRTIHKDLIEKYELPQQEPCCMKVGDVFIVDDARQPDGFCNVAWSILEPFVRELANGGGHFYGDWMKNEKSAMISCNDGFRPVSYLLEAL